MFTHFRVEVMFRGQTPKHFEKGKNNVWVFIPLYTWVMFRGQTPNALGV